VTADLPPCGGDGWQGRGGREGALRLPSWPTPSPPRCARHLSPSSGERRGARHRCCALWRPLCPAGISCFPPLLRSRRVSSSPRPVFTVWLLFNGKRGAWSAPLCCFVAQTTRPAGVFAPMGWAGFVPSGLPAPIGQRSGVPSGLTGQTVTGARVWGGTAPPSRATAAQPTRHRRPPRHPGPAGFPRGRWGHYAGGGEVWDKSRRRKMRK
jgi:hypothetical protein